MDPKHYTLGTPWNSLTYIADTYRTYIPPELLPPQTWGGMNTMTGQAHRTGILNNNRDDCCCCETVLIPLSRQWTLYFYNTHWLFQQTLTTALTKLFECVSPVSLPWLVVGFSLRPLVTPLGNREMNRNFPLQWLHFTQKDAPYLYSSALILFVMMSFVKVERRISRGIISYTVASFERSGWVEAPMEIIHHT